ncbi:hypothetical protein ACFE04_008356 [Oxalis oulophora]
MLTLHSWYESVFVSPTEYTWKMENVHMYELKSFKRQIETFFATSRANFAYNLAKMAGLSRVRRRNPLKWLREGREVLSSDAAAVQPHRTARISFRVVVHRGGFVEPEIGLSAFVGRRSSVAEGIYKK